MPKRSYWKILLLALYASACFFAILLAFNPPNPSWWWIAWLILCFSTPLWLPHLYLLFLPVRKPLKEELEYFQPLVMELMGKGGVTRFVRCLIWEEDALTAAAIGMNTVAFSRRLMEELEPEEFQGVVAHELGHLLDADPFSGTVEVAARACSGLVVRVTGKLLLRFIGVAGGLFGFAALIFVMTLLNLDRAMFFLLSTVMLLVLLGLINLVFGFLLGMERRYAEYRQDAFAARLGYGKALRSALLKISGSGYNETRPWFIRNSSHPILYNRIRRLEKL